MNDKSPSPKEQAIQLRQKLIHYKAELTHCQQKVKQYEKALEVEKENTEFWRKKHSETLDIIEKENEAEELEKRLNLLTNELTEQKMINENLRQKLLRREPVIEEKVVEKVVEKIVKTPVERFNKTDVICFFMNSAVIPSEADEEIALIGNAVIKNQTTKDLHRPVLCLKVHPPNSVDLSGKIRSKNSKDRDSVPLHSTSKEWEYVHQNWKERIKKEGEYWIKPANIHVLPPNSSLSFESFQIIIPRDKALSSLLLEGFFYTEEWKEGVPFLNKIIINLSS